MESYRKHPIKISGLQKEVELMNFMINTREMSLSNKEEMGIIELENRISSKNPEALKARLILNEIENYNSKKRADKIAQMKIEKEKQLNRRAGILRVYNSVIFKAGCAIVITASLGAVLIPKIKEETKPANIVAFDMVTNSYGKVLTNDTELGSQHFDKTEDSEMYAYIEENEVDKDELVEAITKVCDEYDLNVELVMSEVQNDYTNIFNSKQR